MTLAQIIVIVAILWMIIALVSNKVPFAAIAFSIPLLLIIGGVYEKPIEAMAPLTSPSFLLIASIMILCQGMFESGLAAKIGSLLLKLTGGRKNETLILILVIAISTVMTMFLPNTGVATILLPICISVSIASGVSRSRTLFVMNMAVGLGGCITVMGTSINQLCRGMIQDGGYGAIAFLGPGVAAIPAYIIGIAFMLTIGRRLLPNWVKEDASNASQVATETVELTPKEAAAKKRGMIFSGIAFLLVVFGIIFEKIIGIPAWVFGMVGVIILLVTKAVSEKQAFNVPWGILMFVFACTALADACLKSGIAELAIGPLTAILGENPSPLLLTAVFFIVGAFFTQFMSNFGTFGIFAPVAITLATAIGANPAALLLALAMGCNASYATPMATTSNLIIVADGQIKFTDWLKCGLPQVIILGICSIIFLPMFYPFY